MGNDVSLDNASYSMMHSFEEGFFIVLYTGTRSGLVNALIHRNHAVRLILGNDTVMIWNEILLHLGTRIRVNAGGDEGTFKVDMRFFHIYGNNFKVE